MGHSTPNAGGGEGRERGSVGIWRTHCPHHTARTGTMMLYRLPEHTLGVGQSNFWFASIKMLDLFAIWHCHAFLWHGGGEEVLEQIELFLQLTVSRPHFRNPSPHRAASPKQLLSPSFLTCGCKDRSKTFTNPENVTGASPGPSHAGPSHGVPQKQRSLPLCDPRWWKTTNSEPVRKKRAGPAVD